MPLLGSVCHSGRGVRDRWCVTTTLPKLIQVRQQTTMIDGIESYYQRIADGINSSLPDVWRLAWMDAIFYDDGVSYYGSYLVDDVDLCSDFATDRDAERAFREMRALWETAGKTPWCRARFNLFRDGHFRLQLSYDDSDENGFARFDEDADMEHHRQRLTGQPLPLQGAAEQIDPRDLAR